MTYKTDTPGTRQDVLSRLAVLLAVLPALAGTTPALSAEHANLPELPEVMVEDFSAPVRQQILAARDAAQDSPQDVAATFMLGRILHAYKLLPPAIDSYRRARQLDPGNRELVYYLGIARLQSGDDTAALADLRESVQRMPDYRPARLRLAELLMKNGDLDEAIRLFDAILEDEPGNAWALHGLGQARAARGEVEAAIEQYEKAVARYERFGPVHYALGLLYRDLGDSERAREHLERYRRHPKEKPPYDDPLLEALLELDISPSTRIRHAQQRLREGQTSEAERLLKLAIEGDPQSVPAHGELVRLYHLRNDLEQARRHYQAAVAIYPGAVLAGLEYGNLLAEQGRFDEAATVFARVVEYHPGHAGAHGLLGQSYEELGRTREAAEHYRAALASDPTHRHANFLQGRYLLGQGRTDEARRHFDRAVAGADRETAVYLYQTALACQSAGATAMGLDYLQRARQAARDSGQRQLHAQIVQTLGHWQRTTTP